MKQFFMLFMLLLFSLNCFSQNGNIEKGKRYLFFSEPIKSIELEENNYDYILIKEVLKGMAKICISHYDRDYECWFDSERIMFYSLSELQERMLSQALPVIIVNNNPYVPQKTN